MLSISYEEIFSRFYTKVEAYDLMNLFKDVKMQNAILCSWLHSALSAPYVFRLFSIINLPEEDNVEELSDINNRIEFELNYSINDYSDKNFIIEILSYGIALAWIEPKINSLTNISQMFGSSAEKWYAQANHLAEIRALRDDLNIKQRSLIRDRGYSSNDYLDGNSASASLRGSTE